MLLVGNLAKIFIDEVKRHVGHKVSIVEYGTTADRPAGYTLECDVCGATLVTAPVKQAKQKVKP